ncbi:hypothetical protein K1T71_014730 [Dendrolimus kikuchii]|nr:hypothetical protein K1T71_014730 [Dendrolimus kikuchii]
MLPSPKLYYSNIILILLGQYTPLVANPDRVHGASSGCELASPRGLGGVRRVFLALVKGDVIFSLSFVQDDYNFCKRVDPSTDNSCHKISALTTSEAFDECVQSRQAHTRMLVLETGFYDKDPVTVMLLKPITGRRHQLRVHCCAVGHTTLGDYTYSGTRDCAPHRMLLHATKYIHKIYLKNKEQFNKTCDVIDKSYVIGVKYKLFSCKKG